MTLPFWKLSGAGNDFVLALRKDLTSRPEPALARRLCPRRGGVGADGLLVLDLAARPPRLDHFNPDGSKAFCGNGTRCALAWLHAAKAAGRAPALSTAAGLVEGEVVRWDRRRGRGTLRVGMPEARLLRSGLRLRALGRLFQGELFDTGVPHLVVRADPGSLLRFGPALRRHPALGPAGANVDFIRLARGSVSLRTYERGVEGETLACGTGAVAAALAAKRASPVRVFTRGGAVLRVFFTQAGAGWKVSLEGPAEIVFKGEVAL
ncbi:MAG TPA: diaminopimelate epimerase [Elusimicrobia bacterium]|nr:diaminopimelate epimerase [Elusimicrobiota bacterium]